MSNTLDDLAREMLADPETRSIYLGKRWIEMNGALLRTVRRGAQLTQAQIAERMGTTQSAVARMEQDTEGHVTLRRYVDYLRACGYVPEAVRLEPIACPTVGGD